jgi:hypothetical protein
MRCRLITIAIVFAYSASANAQPFEEIQPPAWVRGVTRMTFGTPGEVGKAVESGAQVLHTNLVWPYYPLRRDGGGLTANDRKQLRALVEAGHKRGIKIVLGLPPFMSVAHAAKHPDWRVVPGPGAAVKPPIENDLGTRSGCNVGPWGGYLIDVCAELIEDFGLDGFSFDGNYHPSLCHCSACQAEHKKTGRDLPAKADLKEVAYRQYLVWRGERRIIIARW